MPVAEPSPNHDNKTVWRQHYDEEMPDGLVAIRLEPGTHPVKDPRQLEEHPGRLDYMARLLQNSNAPEAVVIWWNWEGFELDEDGGLIIYYADPTYQPLEEEDLPAPPARKQVDVERLVAEKIPRLFD